MWFRKKKHKVQNNIDININVVDDEEKVYMWTAMLENSCPTCKFLNGKTFTAEQKDQLPFQPGEVHEGCDCCWVIMSGEGTPKATGVKLSDIPKPQ